MPLSALKVASRSVDRSGALANHIDGAWIHSTSSESLPVTSPARGEWRGMGLMQALELVEDRRTREPSARLAAALLEATKKEGLLIGLGGLHGQVIRLGPSLLVTEAQVDDALERLARACREVDRVA